MLSSFLIYFENVALVLHLAFQFLSPVLFHSFRHLSLSLLTPPVPCSVISVSVYSLHRPSCLCQIVPSSVFCHSSALFRFLSVMFHSCFRLSPCSPCVLNQLLPQCVLKCLLVPPLWYVSSFGFWFSLLIFALCFCKHFILAFS